MRWHKMWIERACDFVRRYRLVVPFEATVTQSEGEMNERVSEVAKVQFGSAE